MEPTAVRSSSAPTSKGRGRRQIVWKLAPSTAHRLILRRASSVQKPAKSTTPSPLASASATWSSLRAAIHDTAGAAADAEGVGGADAGARALLFAAGALRRSPVAARTITAPSD